MVEEESDNYELWVRLLLANRPIGMITDGEKAYSYGGYKFVGAGKLNKRRFRGLTDLKLRSHTNLRLWDRDFADVYKEEPVTIYSHVDFYKAMKDATDDIFLCVDDAKFYVPCEHELMVFEGYRKKLFGGK